LDLQASLQFANYNGQGLNPDQLFGLQNGIQELLNNSSKHDFEELSFWGRVEGVKADYYICMGVTYTDKYEFPEKRFYWASSNDFKFKAFPTLNDQHLKTFEETNRRAGLFKGEPNLILIEVAKPAEEAPVEEAPKTEKEKDPLASTEEEDPMANFVPRNLTELDRLQFVVYAIENECHIVPKGSFRLTDQHEVRRNNAFRGLSIDQACQLENYSHFRAVQDHVKQANLEKDECVFSPDFLDEAADCHTKGSISAVRASTKQNVAMMRNHQWPGYTTYHVAGTSQHGAFYFGEGLKNLDLAFQL